MVRRLSTSALLAAILALSGCHLIFRYEDRPPDSGVPVPDLPAGSEAGPSDQGPDQDSQLDAAGPPDLEIKLDQAGSRWTSLSSSILKTTVYGIWGASTKEIYLAMGDGSVKRYGGGGKFSTLLTSNIYPLYALAPLGSSDFIAVGYGGAVRICDRLTQLCSLADPPPSNDAANYYWTGVWCSTGGTCYLAGFNKTEGGLFKRSGSNWTGLCGSLISEPVKAVWGVSDNQVYAAGSDGKIFRYSAKDGCKVVHASSTVNPFTALWASSTGVLAVGQMKGTTNGAGVWMVSGKPNPMGVATYPTLRAVSGLSNKVMVLAGDNGTALWFDGTTITNLKPPKVSGKNPSLYSTWISPSGEIFMGGPSGVLLHYK